MSCSTCNPVEIVCCSNELIIGDSIDINESYFLKIEDVSNGRIILLPITHSAGKMIVDISDFTFADTHSFEFYVVNVNDVETELSWVINGIDVTCLQVRFKRMFDINGDVIIITQQEIVLS